MSLRTAAKRLIRLGMTAHHLLLVAPLRLLDEAREEYATEKEGRKP